MLRTLTLLVTCIIMTLNLQSASSSRRQDAEQARDSEMASTNVPLDSSVYPAFEQLAAEGFVQTAFFGPLPWTRLDCARLIEEAEDQITNETVTSDSSTLLRNLKLEFVAELDRRAGLPNREFRLESLDQRVTAIAGRPLADGFHFAETLLSATGQRNAAFTIQLSCNPLGRAK